MRIIITYNNNLIVIMHSSTCIEAVGQGKHSCIQTLIRRPTIFALWNHSSNIHSYYIKTAP